MIRQRTQPCPALVIVLLIVGWGAGGCTSWNVHKLRMPWQDKEDELTPPERIVTFWSDTVLHQQGQPAIREILHFLTTDHPHRSDGR